MRRMHLAVGLCLALAAPAGIAAQDGDRPITWLAFSKVQTGKTQEAVEMTLEYDRASYDKLVEEGVILSWGIATPINHEPGGRANHAVWVTLPGWQSVDAWTAEFQAAMMARGPEELAKIQQRVETIYEPGSHYDSVRSNLHFEPSTGGQLPRYVYVSYYKAGFGTEQRMFNLFQVAAAPVGRALQGSEQHVHSFGFQSQSLHGDPGWTHAAWFMVADLATVGRIQSGIAKAMTPELSREYAEIADVEAHHDQIWLILHQSGEAAEGG